VGLPLAFLATWWGISIAIATTGAPSVRDAYCPIPGASARSLRQEEIELRRRIASLESDISGRVSQCPICAAVSRVNVGLVIDTSPSMRWPATMDAAAEQRKMAEIARDAGPETTDAGKARMRADMALTPPGQARMDVARAAALAAIQDMPSRARIHLLTFTSFDAAQGPATNCHISDAGTFTNAQRPNLEATLRGLQPDSSGTPLAAAITRAAAAVHDRPVGAPGFVIVVTDGAETCQGDPCAAARDARAADPGLSILLVDIAANQQAACMAQATGGQVIQPAAGADIGRILREALRPQVERACIAGAPG
jgi:hypothetical protein